MSSSSASSISTRTAMPHLQSTYSLFGCYAMCQLLDALTALAPRAGHVVAWDLLVGLAPVGRDGGVVPLLAGGLVERLHRFHRLRGRVNLEPDLLVPALDDGLNRVVGFLLVP